MKERWRDSNFCLKAPMDFSYFIWMDGWMDGWIDGWMDGWMNELILVSFKYILV